MFDCIIVGSGPAGYAAAIYLGRSNSSTLLIGSELTPGGNLVNAVSVENFPGFPKGIGGQELMENMRKQAEKFGAQIAFEDVIAIDGESEVEGNDRLGTNRTWRVQTRQSVYTAKTVILALGSSYRQLEVPGEREFLGKGVSFCATCDGFFFREQPVAVIGGGDTALEEAIFLANFASQVYLVHRRDTLRASKILQDRVKSQPEITLTLNSRVEAIEGDTETGVNGLTLVNTSADGARRALPVKGVFVSIGHLPNTEVVRNLVEVDSSGYIKLFERQSTSQPGIFAAGDATDPIYRQAITAAASGVRAAIDAIQHLEQLL